MLLNSGNCWNDHPEDLLEPTIILRTRNQNTFLAALTFTRQALGKRGGRWVSGTLLPDGSYLDGQFVPPTHLESIRERWRRKRREYVVGINAQLPPVLAAALTAKRGGIPVVSAAGELAEHLGAEGASVLFNFEEITYDAAGHTWPPDRA
jgi:hypothetical protein